MAERDARFVDTDEDGLTDVKELELETNPTVATNFYLQGAYDSAVATSNSQGRQTGRLDVTDNLGNFNLTTVEAYNTVVAERDARPTKIAYDAIVEERDARFVDTDKDGLTDIKEVELETNLAFETRFYLQAAYDNAATQYLREGRKAGRSDVTGNPGDFNLTTVEAYNTVVAERDTRFLDTDKDGLTDVKEAELESDNNELTPFYLQDAYELGVESARFEGRTDVTNNPNAFSLVSNAQYNLVVTQRDARPTKIAYDAIVEERDARFVDTDKDGLTDIKEVELETNLAFETRFYLQAAYDNAATQYLREGRKAGRSDVTGNPGDFNLTTVEAYNTVVAERDTRFLDTDKDGLTDVKEAELESDNNELTPFYLQDAYELGIESARFEGRTDVTNNPNAFSLVSNAQYNFVVAQRDARPTRDAYDTVVEERDARPTLGEVKDARLGSVVLLPDNGNNSVKIRFSIEETDDLKVWTKRDEINEVTVPLELGSKFYRFALQDE